VWLTPFLHPVSIIRPPKEHRKMARGLVLCTKRDTVMYKVWKSWSLRWCFCVARMCGGGDGKYEKPGLPQGPASAIPRGMYAVMLLDSIDKGNAVLTPHISIFIVILRSPLTISN